MNRVRVSLMQVIFCLALVVIAVMVSHGSLDAQDCRIVRIYGGIPQYVEGIRIEPETIWASKGTCVIWNNTMRTDEVKIVFEEGKKCDDMTDASVGFKLDAENCYVTTWIPFGGTSSLMFREEGTFEYVVEAKGGVKSKGKIMIH